MTATFSSSIGFDDATEIILEIIWGSGGDDSKLFVDDLGTLYVKYAGRKNLSCEVLTEDEGHIALKIKGKKAAWYFRHESGRHCVQRVPPTENKGRRQTSFVSVAVLPLPPEKVLEPLKEKDLVIKMQTGRQKAGGQNANSVNSAIRARHVPTGLSVFINGRDGGQNKQEALRILTVKVNQQTNDELHAKNAALRSESLANRGRGDKIRTYNFCDGYVMDHQLNRECRDMKNLMRGDLDLLIG